MSSWGSAWLLWAYLHEEGIFIGGNNEIYSVLWAFRADVRLIVILGGSRVTCASSASTD